MRSIALWALAAALASATFASTRTAPEVEACRERLDRTLVLMEERPLMKEEMATGLMWKRLDAETALAEGETSACHDIMDVVETILAPAPRDITAE